MTGEDLATAHGRVGLFPAQWARATAAGYIKGVLQEPAQPGPDARRPASAVSPDLDMKALLLPVLLLGLVAALQAQDDPLSPPSEDNEVRLGGAVAGEETHQDSGWGSGCHLR